MRQIKIIFMHAAHRLRMHKNMPAYTGSHSRHNISRRAGTTGLTTPPHTALLLCVAHVLLLRTAGRFCFCMAHALLRTAGRWPSNASHLLRLSPPGRGLAWGVGAKNTYATRPLVAPGTMVGGRAGGRGGGLPARVAKGLSSSRPARPWRYEPGHKAMGRPLAGVRVGGAGLAKRGGGRAGGGSRL
jgi:hypothetical protein